MSSFDNWFDNKRPPIYTVHTDRLSQDRCIAEQSYNAGMERAAEIVKPLQDLKGSFAYRAIRKEIEK